MFFQIFIIDFFDQILCVGVVCTCGMYIARTAVYVWTGARYVRCFERKILFYCENFARYKLYPIPKMPLNNMPQGARSCACNGSSQFVWQPIIVRYTCTFCLHENLYTKILYMYNIMYIGTLPTSSFLFYLPSFLPFYCFSFPSFFCVIYTYIMYMFFVHFLPSLPFYGFSTFPTVLINVLFICIYNIYIIYVHIYVHKLFSFLLISVVYWKRVQKFQYMKFS